MKKSVLLLFILSSVFVFGSEADSPKMSASFNLGCSTHLPMISSEFEYFLQSGTKGQFSVNLQLKGFFSYFSPSIGFNYSIGNKHQFITGINLAATHMYLHGFVYDFWEIAPSLSPKLGYRYNFGKTAHKYYIQANLSSDILFSICCWSVAFIPEVYLGFGFYF